MEQVLEAIYSSFHFVLEAISKRGGVILYTRRDCLVNGGGLGNNGSFGKFKSKVINWE